MYELDIFLGNDPGEPICQKAAGRNEPWNGIGMVEKCQGQSRGADHFCYRAGWLVVPHRPEDGDVMAPFTTCQRKVKSIELTAA